MDLGYVELHVTQVARHILEGCPPRFTVYAKFVLTLAESIREQDVCLHSWTKPTINRELKEVRTRRSNA
jgi:hypothetical protein